MFLEALQAWELTASVWSEQTTLGLPARCLKNSDGFTTNRMAEKNMHVLCMDSLRFPYTFKNKADFGTKTLSQ